MEKSCLRAIVAPVILLAVVITAAGCCQMCGTWACFSGSPTNGPVTISKTIQINDDYTYTMVSKVCVHQYSDKFGDCTPQPDEVVQGTWVELNNNMAKLNFPVYGGQSGTNSLNNYAIVEFQPGIPRLVFNRGELVMYRNQADWAKSTTPSGYPISLQG